MRIGGLRAPLAVLLLPGLAPMAVAVLAVAALPVALAPGATPEPNEATEEEARAAVGALGSPEPDAAIADVVALGADATVGPLVEMWPLGDDAFAWQSGRALRALAKSSRRPPASLRRAARDFVAFAEDPERSPRRRALAVLALGWLGDTSSRTLKPLERALDAPLESGLPLAAAVTLARLGKPATRTLAKRARAEEHATATLAIAAIAAGGEEMAGASPVLLRRVEDEENFASYLLLTSMLHALERAVGPRADKVAENRLGAERAYLRGGICGNLRNAGAVRDFITSLGTEVPEGTPLPDRLDESNDDKIMTGGEAVQGLTLHVVREIEEFAADLAGDSLRGLDNWQRRSTALARLAAVVFDCERNMKNRYSARNG